MRIVSEQANSKLQVIPTSDINTLTDEELMAYVIELRGSRGKSVERKARAPKEPGAPKTKQPTITSVAGINLDDLA